MNFIVSTGEVDNVINIMKEVASWGRSVGLNVWKDEHLTREKLMVNVMEEDFVWEKFQELMHVV